MMQITSITDLWYLTPWGSENLPSYCIRDEVAKIVNHLVAINSPKQGPVIQVLGLHDPSIEVEDKMPTASNV